MPTLDSLVVLLSVLASLVLFLYQRNRFPNKPRLPPGPASLPIVGNLFDVPLSQEYEKYTQWGRQYGNVVHVSVFGQHIIVLNSADAANDLLELRSANYSDCPTIPMIHDSDLMDSGWAFTLKQYSPEWRRHRRLFVQYLNPAAAHAFLGKQTSSAHTLLRLLLVVPEQFYAHLQNASSDVIMALAYGYQIQPMNDPWVELAVHFVRVCSEGVRPGGYLVNIFPSLKHMPSWFPGAGFKAYVAEAKRLGHEVVEGPFEDAKKQIAAGTAVPSFVTNALDELSPEYQISDIKEVAATMFGASVDSTVATIHSCVLAMVLNPSVQEQVQAKLDAVLGPTTSPAFRLPTFDNSPNLPYIEAMLKESLRWMPIAPMGIPHAAMHEDVYCGWRIPKGTIVVANAWAILRDEKTYPDPLTFHPKCFLGSDPAPHPGLVDAFGFGRCTCPGRHLAETLLWIEIASLFAGFTVSAAKDRDGNDIDVSYAFSPTLGVVLRPPLFPCTITPHSKEAEMRVRETQPDGILG